MSESPATPTRLPQLPSQTVSIPLQDHERMEKIVSLTKRRGFIFQSSELYGGINGAWDYGPVGTLLKRNVKDAWWRAMVQDREDIVGLEAAILMHPMVWKASGHVDGFSDPMIDCRTCRSAFAPTIWMARSAVKTVEEAGQGRPGFCGGDLTEPRSFNLMFETALGPLSDTSAKCFLRPETAQGHLRQLRQRRSRAASSCRLASRRSASRSETRSTRATSPSARASSSRWRWSSSASRAPTMHG